MMRVSAVKGLIKKFWPQILLIIAVSAFISAYIYQHITFVVAILPIIPILIMVRGTIHEKRIKFSLTLGKSILIVLTASISILNLYGFHFFTEIFKIPFSYKEVINLNLIFLKFLSISVLTITVYATSAFLIGEKIFQTTLKNLKGMLGSAGYAFVSIVFGLGITGTILFISAVYGFISIWILLIICLSGIILNYKTLKKVLSKIPSVFKERRNFDLSIYQALFRVSILIFASTTLVVLTRSFVHSPDALRLYLNLTKYIAENHFVPTTEVMTLMPFFTEVTFAPAYMLGGIPAATLTMYTIAMLYIFGFYLLVKKELSKAPIWIIMPVIAFPPFMQMLAGEYKIDIFAMLFSSAIFYLVYTYENTKEKGLLYITGFICSIAVLTKLTALFFVIPTGIYIIISAIKNSSKPIAHRITRLALIGIISVIPLLPWVVLYKVQTLNSFSIGLGLSRPARYENIKPSVYWCTKEIINYEQNSYFKSFDGSVKSYFSLPLLFILGKGSRSQNMSLLDIGLFLPLGLIFFIYLKLTKNKSYTLTSGIKSLLLISLGSFLIWLYFTPVFIWYAAPIILCLSVILFISIYKHKSTFIHKLAKMTFCAISAIYFTSYGLIHAISQYFPPNLTQLQIEDYLKKSKGLLGVYSNAAETGKLVNNDGKRSKIIFSSSASFSNIYFFIDNYFDRAIFFDLNSETMDENSYLNLLQRYHPEYSIFNVISAESKLECLKKSQEKVKPIFEKYGEVLLETPSYILYKVKF